MTQYLLFTYIGRKKVTTKQFSTKEKAREQMLTELETAIGGAHNIDSILFDAGAESVHDLAFGEYDGFAIYETFAWVNEASFSHGTVKWRIGEIDCKVSY